MQSALNALYKRWKKRPKGLSNNLLSKLAGPDLIYATPYYINAKMRVAIVGQQQKGCDYTYKDFLENWSIPEAIETYEQFYFGQHYNLSPFWQFFREVREHYFGEQCDRGTVAWVNLLKFVTTDEKSILWQDFEEDALVAQGNIINEEMTIIKPDVCIFVTGPHYDRIIQRFYPSVKFADVGLGEKVLSRIIHKDLPQYTFRTYHPNPLRLTIKKWRPVLDKIFELTELPPNETARKILRI